MIDDYLVLVISLLQAPILVNCMIFDTLYFITDQYEWPRVFCQSTHIPPVSFHPEHPAKLPVAKRSLTWLNRQDQKSIHHSMDFFQSV